MKHTVILKWNPAVSSLTMLDFLVGIANEDNLGDWSIYEHESVHTGDTFYMIKVGKGQTGIVMRGVITSDPVKGEDWSGRGREVYYCDYEAEIQINPDTFDLLSSEELRDAIPDFDWFAGHSGVVLNEEQAEKLESLWTAYFKQHRGEFYSRLEKIESRGKTNDQMFLRAYDE